MIKVVDIGALQGGLERLAGVVTAHPEVVARLSSWLDGDLLGEDDMVDEDDDDKSLPTLEECGEMSQDIERGEPISQKTLLRVPVELLIKAERLLKSMADAGAPELVAATHRSRSTVLRVALAVGLQELEKRYGSTSATTKPKPRSRK